MSDLHQGYLLISDISEYTLYLNESELEHAKDTLSDLLKLVIEHNRPPLVISRLEGDAVISYGLQEGFLSGQTFLERIENTYVAFRKAIDRMVLNNTCQCKACANVTLLDLKFLLHYGEFAVQPLGEHHELVGREVNLIHRLLKNRVREQFGFRGYMLCTEDAVNQLGLDGAEESMIRHTEDIEQLGEVAVWVHDMHPVWERERSRTTVELQPEQIRRRLEVHLDLPVEQAWDFLSQPEYRAYLHGSERQEVQNLSQGRIGQGSIYQCYHGDAAIPHTILEWQPFERILTREVAPVPIEGMHYFSEYRLASVGEGTTLHWRFSKPEGPLLGRAMMWFMTPFMSRILKENLQRFKEKVESDAAERKSPLHEPSEMSAEDIHQAAAAATRHTRTEPQGENPEP